MQEAPDETTVNVVQDNSATSDAEPATDVEKSNDIIASPTLEQCDVSVNHSLDHKSTIYCLFCSVCLDNSKE